MMRKLSAEARRITAVVRTGGLIFFVDVCVYVCVVCVSVLLEESFEDIYKEIISMYTYIYMQRHTHRNIDTYMMPIPLYFMLSFVGTLLHVLGAPGGRLYKALPALRWTRPPKIESAQGMVSNMIVEPERLCVCVCVCMVNMRACVCVN